MNSASAPATAGKPARPRRLWEKIIVWGGIAGLLAIVVFEWNSQRQYSASLLALESALEFKSDDETRGIPTEEIDRHLRAPPRRSETKIDSPATAENQSAASGRITFHWPSLFKTYRLDITINRDGRAISVDSSGSADNKDSDPVRRYKPQTRPMPSEGLARADRGTVDLATNQLKPDLHLLQCGSLARELLRQSFLMAARDEWGLSIRDASLGEMATVTASPQAYPLQLNVRFEHDATGQTETRIQVLISRADPSGAWFNWSSPAVVVSEGFGLLPFIEQAEVWARGEFLEALKEAGYAPATEPHEPAKSVPEEFHQQMDFVSQFAVIRQLHSQRKARGETAENLSALARSYANLGNLIEFHWSPAAKVCKARALLYAQRLLAKYGKSPAALAHRAYALALAGQHALAQDDMRAARDFADVEAPKWLKIIESFCAYQPQGLQDASGPLKELACYLNMRMTDPGFDGPNCILAIQQFAALNPACCCIPEMMSATHELGLLRAATEGMTDQMWPRIHARLALIPDLPEHAYKIVNVQQEEFDPDEEHRARVMLIARLRDAAAVGADPIEPSWNALAEMIGDATLVQCWHVLDTEFNALGVRTNRTIKELLPLVKGHRFARCLECYSTDPGIARAAANSLTTTDGWLPAEMPSARFSTFLHRLNQTNALSMHDQQLKNWDLLVGELYLMQECGSPDLQQAAAARWSDVAPMHPRAVIMTINKDWDSISQNAVEWEQKYSHSAPILAALGRKYREQSRSDDALRCLQKSIDVSPTHDAYFALANEYHERGDREAYRATLKQALVLPSYGLDQSDLHRDLAWSYMHRQEWDEARPHALAAAQSYSGGGLQTGLAFAEYTQDWKMAEQFQRALSERYDDSADQWYFWCIRVGHGDVAAARKLAQQMIWEKPGVQAGYSHVWSRAIGEMIDGDLQAALARLSNPNIIQQDVYTFLVSSLLADKLGNAAVRDDCFHQIEFRFDATYPLPTLVKLFRNALRDRSDLRWNRHDFEELVELAANEDVCFLYYCAGLFLDIHSEHELGREYLVCAATALTSTRWGCILASQELRAQDASFGPLRFHTRPDSWYPWFSSLNFGYRALREKKFERAQACFDSAIQGNPTFTTAYMERGRLNERQGKYAAAIQEYEAILKFNPDCENARLWLANIMSCCHLEEFRNGAAALTHAEHAFERRVTKTWFNYTAMAAAHAELGNFDRANEYQDLAIKLVPRNAVLMKQKEQYLQQKPERNPPPADLPIAGANSQSP